MFVVQKACPESRHPETGEDSRSKALTWPQNSKSGYHFLLLLVLNLVFFLDGFISGWAGFLLLIVIYCLLWLFQLIFYLPITSNNFDKEGYQCIQINK